MLHYNNVKHSVTNFTPAQLFKIIRYTFWYISTIKSIKESSSNYHKKTNWTFPGDQENEKKYFETNEKHLKGDSICTFELDDIKSLIPMTSFMSRKIFNDNYVIRDANNETAKCSITT